MSEDTFSVRRTTAIDAPTSAVYVELVDFRRWESWSPWEGLDPDQRRTYSGADSGVGSKYGWVGNRKVGAGSMEIVSAVQDSSVEIRLEFLKPFKATNTVLIELTEDDGSTAVSWTMTGAKTLMTKIMCVFWPMEKVVCGDFERGLAQLKALIESVR